MLFLYGVKVDFFEESDIKATSGQSKKETTPAPARSTKNALEEDESLAGLSARERNRLKGKAKLDLKNKGRCVGSSMNACMGII
jgi:hypothetical protein